MNSVRSTYTKEVTIKRYVVISDLQYPYIKKQYVESLLDYIDYVKPDKLLCVGDELDAQTISTYARGTSLEFEGSLQKNIIGLKGLLKEFRSAIGRSKPFIMQRSNHTARIERYISKFAPAFSVIDAIKIENLLGYNEKDINVKYNRSLTEVAKGVLLVFNVKVTNDYSGTGKCTYSIECFCFTNRFPITCKHLICTSDITKPG